MKWRYPDVDEFPPPKKTVLLQFQSGDYEDREMTSHNDTLKAWWKRNVERWLDEGLEQSPDTTDDKALEKEAEIRFPHTEAGATLWGHNEIIDLERAAYVKGRRKSITREKELEELLAQKDGEIKALKGEVAEVKSGFTSSVFSEPAEGIMLGCISPEARELLDTIMASWEPHYEELKKNNENYEPSFYGFAYWLVRWSGLIQPEPPTQTNK